MCGIVGQVNLQNGSVEENVLRQLRQMADAIVHRGPDAEGYWFEDGVGLAHRRLSIIDLTPSGAQPMSSRSGRFSMVFNGEIYNYLEIREQLDGPWRGHSDTEVILEAFEKWGFEETFKKLIGMFAIAVWDRENRAMTLSRDRIGEKPLMYGWAGSTFLFGSSLDAMKQHPNFDSTVSLDALSAYFRQLYVPDPLTIYTSYRKLSPGTFLTFAEKDLLTPGTMPVPTTYWSLAEIALRGIKNRFTGSYEDAVNQLESILTLTVKGQMISDVPFGAFLSGGIDSSTVVALMQNVSSAPIKTFTVGFDERAFNEADFAESVAKHLGTDHHTMMVTSKDAMDVIPLLPNLYDEPFADSSQIPTYLVSKAARSQVTVSLTGDGGDEVFAGYNRHVKLLDIYGKWNPKPKAIRTMISGIIQTVPAGSYEWALRRVKTGVLSDQLHKFAKLLKIDDIESMYLALTEHWEDSESLVKGSKLPKISATDPSEWPEGLDALGRMLWAESMTSLPGDMLVKVDRASMGVSLETRVPFLDQRVIEFAWSLPDDFKIQGSTGKRVLRSVLEKHVPRTLTDRPKAGFGVPVDEWLKGPLKDWAEELLSESSLNAGDFLDTKRIRSVWNEHLAGKKKHTGRLWGLLMFQAWRQERCISNFR